MYEFLVDMLLLKLVYFLIINLYFCAACDVSSFKNVKISIMERAVRGLSEEYINDCLDGTKVRNSNRYFRIFVRDSIINELKYKAVSNLSQLQSISFFYNSMSTISAGAFFNLPSISQLTIEGNELEVVAKGIFNVLPLKELVLAENNIQYIEAGAFANMTQLNVIDLSKNKLSMWNSKWLSGCSSLEKIKINNNLLEVLPNYAFEEFDKLEWIYLQENKLHEIEPMAFKGNFELVYLDLSKNQLKFLHQNTVFGKSFKTENGARIYLENNNLQFLPKQLLKRLDTLKYLDINMNPWTCSCYDAILKWAEQTGVRIYTLSSPIYPVCVIPMHLRKECIEVYDEEAFSHFNNSVKFLT